MTYTFNNIGTFVMSWEIGKQVTFSQVPTTNSKISSEDLLGKFSVLYFYPKDNTPGCTTETKDFIELLPQFAELNCQIFGVSKDSVASHNKFTDKYSINFPLISDTALELCNAAGIYVEKSMYGRKYMGVERTTYLLDPDNKIINVWQKVKVPQHAQTVLDYLVENTAK